MDGEGAEEDRKNKKAPKDKKEKKEKKDKKGKDGKEQAEQESTDVPAAAVGAVTADSSPSAGVEVKPKKIKAKKEKKEKKAEPLDPEDDLQGLPDEAKDAEGEPEHPEDRDPDDRHPKFSNVASELPPAEPPGEGEEVAAGAEAEAEAKDADVELAVDAGRADEPRASDPAVQQFVGEQPAGEEETGETEDFPEVRVALPDDEVEPLMGSEHRRSQVPSVPAEDVMTGPPPLQLGTGSGLAHDINIPEREVEGPRRYSLTGQESVRRCIECDLVWDMAVTHCSRCQKQLVEGSIQVTEFLNGSQLEFLEQAFKRYDVDGSGRLDGKELRMAVRELGWDTKQDVLDRWARVGGNQGLNLDQFKNLIASGKLGRKTFKPITGKASQAVKDERRQLLAMGGAAPQFTARQRPGRRGALIPGATQELAPDESLSAATPAAPAFGEGQSVFEELPAHRKVELIEAWAFWDADHSGFLEPIELMNASKGLGFHLPIESVVAVCGKHGGGIDQENFVRVMSVQIKHRDEELGLWKGANALPLEEEGLDDEDSTTLRAKRKKELAKAELNLRRTSVTDKNFKWRNLLCTSHATVGEYAIGVRLYFDLLLLLVIAFGVLTATTLPFLLMCASSSGGGPVLKQTDDVLSTLAKYSVGNLVRSPAADATVHIMNEFFGSMALLGVLLLYRFVIIHRATYTTNSRNLANLAIQVRGLPTDLGYHHLGYEELLREHFQTVAYEQALRMGTERELDDQPVREVVLWRNYDAAVHGVLQQVELQAKQFSVNTELKFLEQKAREHDLSEELEHDLGYNAGGGLAPTSGRRQSTKGRQTMKVMADRQSAASIMSQGQEESNFSHAVTTNAERMYDRMCSRADGGKRLAKRQTYLLSMNDLIEEQILEIETERALHSDLKPEEREVMGAFVVFWCQRTRDAVLGQYGWSRSWCCRACCQRRRLRLKLPFEESSGSEGAPDEEEVAFPLIVEATQDPSLQLWQNMDVKPLMRLAMGCVMSICRFLVLNLIFIVACITMSTHVYYPLFLPIDAKVWLITNVSEPVVSSSDDVPCWRSCELELFGDELCSERKDPYMFVSSNGLPMRRDAGLQAVGDRNLAGGSMCISDWRSSSCWEAINLEYAQKTCHEGRGCSASRRLESEDPMHHWSEDAQEETRAEAPLLPSTDTSRKLTAACPWVSAGSYNLSLITYTIRYQTKASSLAGATAIQTLLKTSLASALGLNPMTLSDTSSVRQPYVFSVQPPLESLPPPVLGPGCGDSPDAVPQLLQWLGLSGPATRILTSCKDFARMGLLGVPFCDNVPQDYRCLCAETCGCPCASDTCDCQAPALGVDLLPLPEPGEVITWETDLRICSQDGDQLAALTCGFSDIFDTRQSNPSLAALAETWLQSQRELGIFPITVFQGPPVGGGCNSALQCGIGSVRCYSRFNEQVCAKRCDGVEECLNATDELGCRSCGSVAGSSTQSPCTMPVGRCADHQTSASACMECSNATQLSIEEAKQCSLLNIPAGATAEGAKQCNASFCDVLQPGGECDPGSLTYDPCQCLEARQVPEQRAAFGCLLRGNLSAAVRSTTGLLSLFHFDAIRAKLVEDWFGSHILECHNSEGSSGGCAVTSVDRVEGLALLLAGTDWLQSAAEVPAPSAHAIHMWVMSTCTSCTIAGLLGGGTLYVDGSGYLAAKSPSGTAWQPAAGPLLNDGNFHFVAFSLGSSHGEVLLADGTVLAQRSFQDAQSAGWSSPAPVKVMFGKSQTEAALGNYSGEIDVAAVFTAELSLKELRHHMLAGSWRGPGLTFAERYLTAACEDSRLATSTYPPCGTEAEAVLAKTRPCVQGDFCGCHSLLRGEAALLCAVSCPGTSTLRRSLSQILEERCSDNMQLGKSCQFNSDCDLLFPPIGQESKLECDIETWKCKLQSSMLQPQHVLRGSVCIARASTMPPLGQWQAQYLLAHLAKTNSSLFLSVEVQEGCSLPDANVTDNLVSAHNGGSSYLKQEVNFQTTVTRTSTTTSSTTTYGNFTNISDEETTDLAPSPPEENTTTTTTPSFPGKLQVRTSPLLIFGAGGVQTLTITANATPDGTGMEDLETAAARLQASLGAYVSQETIPDVTFSDMTTEVPDVEVIVFSEREVSSSLISNISYAIMGTALTSVTYEEPELCSDAEFECAPGVCVLCPAGSCQCDGWQDCENGADEDVWGVLLQRNVTTAACVQMRNLSTTDTSVNENGTVAGDDPCFGQSGFPCNSTVCVPISRTCDGVQDCPGGEDEEGCPVLPESDDSNSSDKATWVAAVFFDSTEIKCAKLAQPDGVVSPEVQLMACSVEAVTPQVLDVAKANGSNVASPLRKPSSNCVYMATITTNATPIDLENPTFMRTEVDNANGQISFGSLRCAVGPNLKNHEIIGLATAEMAYNADNASKVVKCYCMQRMYLEPEVFLALADTDKRATMCTEYIGISQGNYHRSWIRVGIIVLFNELFEALIRGTSTSVRYKDETTRLVRHFRNLFWFWLLNSALIPAFVSCTIPAFWGWLLRTLEIEGTDVGGMSMREWHGWVGCVITLVMGIRVVIPQVPDLLAIGCRRCSRWRKARKTISQEDLKNLYVNPEFRLAEGFAETAVTASLAMIFGPALPLLNVLAAASCFTRYLVDWYVFLRHSRRPPMFDETIARVCVDHLLLGLVLRSAASILVWVDPVLFVSDVAGCSFSEDDVNTFREKYFMENFRMFELFVNPTCNPTAWFFGFLPGLSAVGCLLVLPNLTILRSLLLVLCRRCRSKTGYLYDDVVQARMQRKLVPSYQPRVHPAYQSAFKLMDLTANFNEQGLSDSSESRASTDLASEEGEEQEDNTLAATIFGKEYESMEYFKREKAEKKARKKEKKEKGGGDDSEKKHKKRRKSKSTDPFMDDDVNPYDAGANDKHKKKKKKDKGSKKDEAQFSEAKELAGIIDF